MDKRIILLFLVCAFCLSLLKAQTVSTAPYCSGGIFYDQDYTLELVGFKNLNEDRNYTMGIGLYYSGSSLNNWLLYEPHKWLFGKLKPKRQKDVGEFFSFMLGNGSFTPDSLPAYYPILNDRPYASLTYFQTNASFLDADKYKMYTISLSFAMLGTGVSREVQTYIHKKQNDNDTKAPRTPRGWSNQISNGGAPSILIAYQQDYLMTKKPLQERENGNITKINRLGGEWKAGWKINLGWYNMASGELAYRFGWINPRNWTYATNPLGQSNMFAKAVVQEKTKGEAYLFANVRTNLVAYNVLLSGQGGKDPVNLPNSWVRHGVLDGAWGFCLSPAFGHKVIIDLKGKFNFRSPEFEAPGRKPRWHYWGGIELTTTILH